MLPFYQEQRYISGLSHQNLQVSPGLRQTNSCDRCSHPCEQRSSTQYCPGDFDGIALKVYTDEYNIYGKLPEWKYEHKIVNHGAGEYARDEDAD